MSLLVRKGTMVRSKRRQSTRKPAGQSTRGYVNSGLTPDDRHGNYPQEGHSGKTSPALSASSSKYLIQSSDTFDGTHTLDEDFEPISYGTIFRQLQEANDDSPGTCDFLQRIYYIFCSSLLMTMLLVLLLILPISMISVGASYMGDCPEEPNIPLYLLIGGCLGFIKVLLLLWYQQKVRRYEKLGDTEESEDEENTDEVMSRSARFTNQGLSVFLFVWFILGNYWVFSIWQPNYQQPLYSPNNWCDRFVYLFTFYKILTLHGVVAFILIVTICFITCNACKNSCRGDRAADLA